VRWSGLNLKPRQLEGFVPLCPHGTFLSPQPPKLFANETLYQLSYTPNLIDFSELHGNLRSMKDTCLYRYRPMKANSINGATKAQHQPAPRTIPNVPCLKRHEIYGTYYAVKKIRGKIKTHALRSESRISITDRKLASENFASGWMVWNGEEMYRFDNGFRRIARKTIAR
jgi:hypothetical protein